MKAIRTKFPDDQGRHGSDGRGLSLLELLTVLLIISILSAMAVNIYIDQVERARIAAAKTEIEALENAAVRYFVDVGQFPPSGSGTLLAPNAIDPAVPYEGCGYLQVAVIRSLNGDPYRPLESRWNGPYFEVDLSQLGTLSGAPLTSSTPQPQIQILDPWGFPYFYVRSGRESTMNLPADYVLFGATQYPITHPLAAAETFFNFSSVQIISFGPNRTSLPHPNIGLDEDDITNFDSDLMR